MIRSNFPSRLHPSKAHALEPRALHSPEAHAFQAWACSRSTPGNTHGSTHGFTVLEVLIAIGIFAIGFAAVAAIFPAAAVLQRQTMDDMTGKGIESSVTALLTVRQFEQNSLNNNQATNNNVFVHALESSPDTNPIWTTDDLTFPQSSPTPLRRFSASLLVRKKQIPATDKSHWQVFAFILRKVDDTTPIPTSIDLTLPPSGPSTFNLDTNLPNTYSIRPGDQILDNLGNIHTVKDVNTNTNTVTVIGTILQDANAVDAGNPNGYPTAIWYVPAPSADRVSPTLRIIGPLDAVRN